MENPKKDASEIRVLNRKILDDEVSIMLLKLVSEVLDLIPTGQQVDVERYARNIVSHCREHLVG